MMVVSGDSRSIIQTYKQYFEEDSEVTVPEAVEIRE